MRANVQEKHVEKKDAGEKGQEKQAYTSAGNGEDAQETPEQPLRQELEKQEAQDKGVTRNR